MAIKVEYDLIPWEDAPSTATPINAENLNKQQTKIKEIIDELYELDEAKLGKEEIPNVPVKSVNGKTGAVSLGKTDIGLGNVDNVKQYSASNPPPYPVTSVNGKTGAVTVSVPTKTSQLTNDSNFVTKDVTDQLSGQIADYNSHKSNTGIHVTSAEKQVWNGKANLTDLPTITQESGNSESLVMSQKAVTELVSDALDQIEKTEYETVDSVAKMTDTKKQYVFSETGTVWTYGETYVEVEPTNKFVSSTAQLNKRLSSSDVSASNGMFATDYIEFDGSTAKSTKVWIPLDESQKDVGNQRLWLCDANKNVLYSPYIRWDYSSAVVVGYDEEKKKYYMDMSVTKGGTQHDMSNVKYVRMCFLTSKGTTSISSSDITNVEILFENDRTTGVVNDWYDTGLTPESASNGGNYVDLLVKVNENRAKIEETNTRLIAVETGSGAISIPSFWQSAVDECIAKIKALQVGRNCITFPFFSDNHQRNGYSGMLIAYIMKECNIPYCFFGGDSISSGTIVDEAEMIAQDKAFDTIMSYVPNGRFCRAVGNHDGYWYDGTNKYYYTKAQVYELFLREESVAQNKHFGDDGTYYYVDDIASKTRFTVLNTNNSVDSTQLTWLQNTALKFNESGWAVVFISHQPISNHYHALISNAEEVRTVVRNYINGSATNKADIVGWYSGHIHRDRIYTGVATNTSDDTQGTAMGFTQVTITSDHTGIAYDDATKHTVANDNQSHAIDFVTINKTARTVNITRLGIGNDRSYTY